MKYLQDSSTINLANFSESGVRDFLTKMVPKFNSDTEGSGDIDGIPRK